MRVRIFDGTKPILTWDVKEYDTVRETIAALTPTLEQRVQIRAMQNHTPLKYPLRIQLNIDGEAMLPVHATLGSFGVYDGKILTAYVEDSSIAPSYRHVVTGEAVDNTYTLNREYLEHQAGMEDPVYVAAYNRRGQENIRRTELYHVKMQQEREEKQLLLDDRKEMNTRRWAREAKESKERHDAETAERARVTAVRAQIHKVHLQRMQFMNLWLQTNKANALVMNSVKVDPADLQVNNVYMYINRRPYGEPAKLVRALKVEKYSCTLLDIVGAYASPTTEFYETVAFTTFPPAADQFVIENEQYGTNGLAIANLPTHFPDIVTYSGFSEGSTAGMTEYVFPTNTPTAYPKRGEVCVVGTSELRARFFTFLGWDKVEGRLCLVFRSERGQQYSLFPGVSQVRVFKQSMLFGGGRVQLLRSKKRSKSRVTRRKRSKSRVTRRTRSKSRVTRRTRSKSRSKH